MCIRNYLAQPINSAKVEKSQPEAHALGLEVVGGG